MYKLVESKDIIFLLSWFRNLFTAPSFEYFCCFVQSLMGLEKEGFVTNVYLSSNSKKHWTNFHRFLSSYRWSTFEVSRKLLWLLLKVLKHADQCERLEIIGALDDTPTEKHGSKSDISLSPGRVLQLYSARWKIELAFRELKQMGKMADYRVRSKAGMTRHVTLCFVAHSLLRLLPLTKIQLHAQPMHRPWYKKKEITIGQLRILFQRECMLQLFFRLLGQLGITHEKEKVIGVFNGLLNPINKNQYEQIIMEKDELVYSF